MKSTKRVFSAFALEFLALGFPTGDEVSHSSKDELC